MTQQRLALELGQKPRIELDWGTYMREFEVRFDGELLGRIDGGQKALREPHSFTLPDGSELTIRLKQSQMIDELEVLRDGVPLPGSASSTIAKLSAAVRSSFFWGIAAVIAGLTLRFTDYAWVMKLTFSPYSILFGVIMIMAAIVLARRSLPAAIVALIAFLLDWVVASIIANRLGIHYNFLSTFAILIRVLALLPLFQVVMALRDTQPK